MIVAGREARQAEQVEGNHEQDAEQDRNHHDPGRESLHTGNITGLDGTWLGSRAHGQRARRRRCR
jgi:hypothetical protein